MDPYFLILFFVRTSSMWE